MSVTSAFRMVRAVAERADPTAEITTGELATQLGMSLSAASRLAAELAAVQLLQRVGYGCYRLGARSVRLSGRAAAPVARSVGFALTLAAQQTGETACLAAESEGGMRIIAAVTSVWTLHSPAELGDRVHDPRSAIVRAAHAADPGFIESTVGQSVEVAVRILGPQGECLAVLAVRMPANRAHEGVPRARRALRTARQSIERDVAALRREGSDHLDHRGDSALAAALGILDHLADAPDTLSGVAAAVGLRRDRTQRLLESCERAGVVIADASGYSVAWSVHGWYRAALTPTIIDRGRPLVAATAGRTGACAYITVLRGMRSFTLVEELEQVGEGLRMAPWQGRPHPIIGSDGGAALASDFDPAELALLLPNRHSPREVTELQERVARVAERGVLTIESIDEAGQVSISAPVRDAAGAVAAAACIVGATDYIRPRVKELEAAAQQLAREVSALLR